MSNGTEMIILMTSFPNKTKALKQLITGSIKQGLSTCVQQVNYMKSFYLREGELKKQHEKLLMFKGPASKKEKLIGFIKKMHPYEVPEIVVLTPSEADEKYMGWIMGKNNSK